jgi:hypothetical protein
LPGTGELRGNKAFMVTADCLWLGVGNTESDQRKISISVWRVSLVFELYVLPSAESRMTNGRAARLSASHLSIFHHRSLLLRKNSGHLPLFQTINKAQNASVRQDILLHIY